MRILFVTSRIPYPPYRGDKLKIFNLIRQLAARHELFLLTFVQNREELSWVPELRKYCRRVEAVRLSSAASLWHCLTALPGSVPFQVAYFSSRSMVKAVQRLVAEIDPDVIHTHLIRMAQYTAGIPDRRRVLDLTDAVSLYLQQFSVAVRNPLKRFALRSELHRMLRYEPILSRFDRALVCSTVDREALLRNVPDARVDVMENGVDLDSLTVPADRCSVDPFRIIYTGNMSYYPNADGARYFVRSIFPLVKRAVPQARVYLVGQNPPRSVRSLARSDVIVTGFVKDIRGEYLKSAVAISPVRFGAGTLNKILEPLALGIPVVATSHGSVGLGLNHDAGILIADGPAEFAREVIGVLTGTAGPGAVPAEETERIRKRFSWDTVGRALCAIYDDIMSAPGHPNSVRAFHRP